MRRVLDSRSLARSLPVVLLSVLACSGASQATFIGEPGTQDSGNSASSSGGGFDATTDARGNGSGSDATPDDSSNVGPEDAMGDGSSGAGDAALDAGPPGISCPQMGQANRCMSGETCCLTTTTTLAGTTQNTTCQTSTCSGTPLTCSSQANCPQGQVCCGTETDPSAFARASYQDVSCAATCTSGPLDVPTRVQFCDPGDTCPAGTTCQTSTVIQDYTVCR